MRNHPIRSAFRTPAGLAPLLLALAACGSEPTRPGPTPPADPLARLTLISGSGQTATAGHTLTDTLVVEARTQAGKPAAPVRVSATPTGGSVSPDAASTDATGRARFVWTLPAEAGRYEIRFTTPAEPSIAAAVAHATATPGVTLHRAENLSPGATARLYGTGLDRVAELQLDGTTVSLLPGSDTLRTFVVPILRACETDGRAVTLAAGSARLAAQIHVPNTLALEVGESRVLAPRAGDCIQLPVSDQDYVLTAANVQLPDYTGPSAAEQTLLRFTTGAEDAPSARFASARTPARPAARSGAPATVARRAAQASSDDDWPYSRNPVPFDPKYATAKVGETVRFPDVKQLAKSGDRSHYCSAFTREQVYASTELSYPVQIAAIVDNRVFAVDLRMPDAAKYLTPENQAYLERAGRILSPVLLPAIRQIISADYQPLKGGGGRHYFLFTGDAVFEGEGSAMSSDGITNGSQSECDLSSEMGISVYSATTYSAAGIEPDARVLASVMVHESTHTAEAYYSLQHNVPSVLWLTEPLAVAAQEVASRIASDQPTQASRQALGPNSPYEKQMLDPAWGGVAARRGLDHVAGSRQFGALFYLTLREQAGEAGFDATSPTLYERIVAQNYPRRGYQELWSALEIVVGKSASDLLDYATLAAATDDLVDPAAAAKHKLPQIASWDSRSHFGNLQTADTRIVSRSLSSTHDLQAAPTGYDAAYFLADGGLGLSIAVTDNARENTVIRLTRLR